ncbi:cupin domain-containing protein [Rhizobium leguminosarum]|uniref:cupin domain-containing protein n=1 Tax=Rhizobium leguminosarum TaxID=384 RepID=UPI0014429563|nr:cupin domain-containing protein [Rhizobium leguminosarum]MBY5863882.1 cupin domain-containing protein [Rhizobium leguminosarum]NKM05823.1 cupin domain-containing protein [Rhizobium leguminosarum bv. viciae]
MATLERPAFVVHWSEIERPDNSHYDDDDELMSIGAPFGRYFGLAKLGIHHERLPPGRRTSFPHAESAEEEFVYVIEGAPDVWLDGYLYRLKPGDAVGFPAGTGIAHSFLNNTQAEVHLLVVGERHKAENRIFYPLHPHRRPLLDDWWDDHPTHALGPHDGMPDLVREAKDHGSSE